MPILLAGFVLLPLLFGLAVEYLLCRFTRRRLLRALPPAGIAALAALIAVGRWRMWQSEQTGVATQLLIFPILPGFCLLLGMYLGWRLWRRIWLPRIVRDR